MKVFVLYAQHDSDGPANYVEVVRGVYATQDAAEAERQKMAAADDQAIRVVGAKFDTLSAEEFQRAYDHTLSGPWAGRIEAFDLADGEL